MTVWYEEQYPVLMAKRPVGEEMLPFISFKAMLGDRVIF